MISRIIKVEVGVNDIGDNPYRDFNNNKKGRLCSVIVRVRVVLKRTVVGEKKCHDSFCFFTDGEQHKVRELDMITLRDHATRSYMT